MNEVVRSSMIDGGPVDAALAEYLLRQDRGEAIDWDELVAAYPGCEAELRNFIAQEANVHRVLLNGTSATATSHHMAGRTLGDFQLLRILGRGGMGIVWEAEQISLPRKVAVKLLPGALCADPRHRMRFQNEARILAQLEHPNIVSVIAVGEEADTYYFAMRYVEGITADDLIRMWQPSPRGRGQGEGPHPSPLPQGEGEGKCPQGEGEGKCPQGEGGEPTIDHALPEWAASANPRERYRLCARIAREIAAGLAHAHACGVLHRDVKPSNILLDTTGAALLTDFGLARMYGDATLTATGTILGTLRYASPEQLGCTAGGMDERSDVFSLGATLWELVTCRRLFASEDRNSVITQVLKNDPPRPSSFAVGLPRDMETMIAQAMAKSPGDRYATAQAFADDLTRFLDGRPIQAKPISMSERAFRWANRNRARATAALGATIAVALLAVFASALILRANARTAAALQESRENETHAKRSAAAAEASERKSRELLYAADMALAGAAWSENEPAQARMYLDRYARPITRADGSEVEDLRGFEWHFLDGRIRAQAETLFQNDRAIYLVEFMPNGKEFYTAGQDSIVRWHDSTNGNVLRHLDTRQKEINCVSYNSSGTLFATAGDDGTVKVWNAANRTLRHSFDVDEGICYYARFLDDEHIFTSFEGKPKHLLLNAISGSLVREYVPPKATAPGVISPSSYDVHVSESGNRVWTIGDSHGIQYEGIYEWDIAQGISQEVCRERNINRVLADQSERFLFINSMEGRLRVVNATDGAERWSVQLDNTLEALSLSPDERRIAVGDRNGQVYLWNLDLTGSESLVAPGPPVKLSVHDTDVYDIEFSPDGKSLITASRDGSVRRTALANHLSAYQEITWLRNQQCISLPGTDRVVVFGSAPLSIRDLPSGKVFKELSATHYPTATVSSDGMLVAAASPTVVTVWDVPKYEEVYRLEQRIISMPALQISPNNRQLAVITHSEQGRAIEIIEIAKHGFRSDMAIGHANGLYYCVNDGLIGHHTYKQERMVCWNLPNRTIRWQTNPLEFRCKEAAISPDRKSLLIAERRGLVLIDCASGTVKYRVPCDYSTAAVAFLGDGRSFVVGGDQGELSLWHTATGRRLFEIANIESGIHSIQRLDNGFLASTRRIRDGREQLVWLEF